MIRTCQNMMAILAALAFGACAMTGQSNDRMSREQSAGQRRDSQQHAAGTGRFHVVSRFAIAEGRRFWDAGGHARRRFPVAARRESARYRPRAAPRSARRRRRSRTQAEKERGCRDRRTRPPIRAGRSAYRHGRRAAPFPARWTAIGTPCAGSVSLRSVSRNHHIGCLDHCVRRVSVIQLQLVDRLVGN